MPTFRATVEKYMPSRAEYWTNVYHVIAADLTEASTHANSIATHELALYTADITLTKVRVDDMNPLTDQFLTTVRNAAGTRTTATGEGVVLFVVGRVDFSVADFGRPCRKYIRGLYEVDVVGMNLSTEYLGLLNTYANALEALPICDPAGKDITTGEAFPQVAMRQLRRGSKKRSPHSAVGQRRRARDLSAVPTGSLYRYPRSDQAAGLCSEPVAAV